MKASLFILLIASCPFFSLNAQKNTANLNLDRIFSKEFEEKRMPALQWINDSCFSTYEAKTPGSKKELLGYNARTGEKEVIVSAQHLVPPGQSTPVDVNNYLWGRNGSRLLIYTNSQEAAWGGSKGDYWVLDLLLWTWYKVGEKFPAQSLKNAKFSPDGNKISYLFNNNLYVENLSNYQTTQLTFDGTDKLLNGEPKGCNNSMLNLRYTNLLHGMNGYTWSPDGKQIAFVQANYSEVPDYYMINNTETLYPKIISFPYVKVGQQLPSFKVGIASLSGEDIQWLNVSENSSDDYLWQMEWTPNPGELSLQLLDRRQQNMRIMLADIKGNIKTIHTEKDDAWIEPNNIFWIDGGKKFIFTSEQDGWSHLYLFNHEGKQLNLLTPGNWDVIVVQGIDEKNGLIYYIASPDNPSQRYLYRVAINGDGKSQRVSPVSMPGTHQYDASPGFQYAVHTYSTFDKPPVYSVVQLPAHKQITMLEDNHELAANLKNANISATEFFRVNIGDGVLLDGYCIKPKDMDTLKKYPLLFYVYGEPALQTVLDVWNGRQYLWHQMLAQQGYLVMSVDNRGTPAPRGRSWRKAIYKQLGILAPKDQAAATQALIKERPYIDPARIGAYGHSGGGQMSLHLIFRFPEIYSLAMPSAFVSNQLYYHPSYQERFMGPLDENLQGYHDGSPINWAKQLKGKLLIIHGTGDANVHFQSFENLVNVLVANKKRFSMMTYPNRNHGLQEGENTQYHLFDLRTNFLMTNMPPGPR